MWWPDKFETARQRPAAAEAERGKLLRLYQGDEQQGWSAAEGWAGFCVGMVCFCPCVATSPAVAFPGSSPASIQAKPTRLDKPAA